MDGHLLLSGAVSGSSAYKYRYTTILLVSYKDLIVPSCTDLSLLHRYWYLCIRVRCTSQHYHYASMNWSVPIGSLGILETKKCQFSLVTIPRNKLDIHYRQTCPWIPKADLWSQKISRLTAVLDPWSNRIPWWSSTVDLGSHWIPR